jgi:hypothetical protein
MSKEMIRIMRLIIYEGEREVIEKVVENSIHGTKIIKPTKHEPYKITAVTLEEFPQILAQHEEVSLEDNEKR